MRSRPMTDEYIPYFERYITLVPDGYICDILLRQRQLTLDFLSGIPEQASLYRYGSDKWSIKEVVGHIADTERVMAYRLLCAARGEQSELPGFDQDQWMREADFTRTPFEQILSDFRIVREATLSLTKALSEDAWVRCCTVWEHSTSARAFAYIIAGHELHHRTILQERYVPHIS